MVGVQVGGAPIEPLLALEQIERAEAAGVSSVWLTQASTGADALTLLAAAAQRTNTIGLGVAVLPAVSRHPLVTASQAATVARLSTGRLRLGLGTSHRQITEDVYGIAFDSPQERLRDYVAIVRRLLATGVVEYDGAFWSAHASAPPCPVPLLLGALGPKGFELAGELADGAISWLCPPDYLRAVARPALERGARAAARSAPPLVAHLLVAVTTDRPAALAAAAKRIAPNAAMPYYARMLERAGVAPAPARGPERAADALLVSGRSQDVAEQLRAHLDDGLDELLLTPVRLGGDPGRELQDVFAAVGCAL